MEEEEVKGLHLVLRGLGELLYGNEAEQGDGGRLVRRQVPWEGREMRPVASYQ